MSSPTWRPTWVRRAERLLVARRRRSSSHDAPAGTVALGDGLTGEAGVAPKAALLDRAARAGLDVPDGVVVLDGTDLADLAETVADWLSARDISSCAVRSAFAGEDGDTSSRAGWYHTELGVEPRSFVDAAARVRASGGGAGRLDVLVMGMVEARHAGVAFSEPGTYDDVVNVTIGLADQLVSGAVEGERLLLPRLEGAEPGWSARLHQLLADVRDVFGDRAWDVEWADDGSTCWLVQIRPITSPTLRDELLTLANHAEILPGLPSTLMTSVIERAGPDLFAWYRRRVPGLPVDRDFLYVVAGRPMINLSLLEDMMRHLGLPTAVVADSIGGDGGTDRPAAPGRIVGRAPALLRLGLAQFAAVALARRNQRRVASLGDADVASIGEALDRLHVAYVTLVTGMFPLSSAIGPPLAVLRRTGTLLDHAATHRTITTEMAGRLAEVRSASATGRPALLRRFVEDFGHRGVYESDIARPRFVDDPTRLDVDEATASGSGADGVPAREPRRTWRWWMTRPLWLAAARPLAARERYRHEAMRSFLAIRRSLTASAARAAERGQLPSGDDLWLLDVEQARSLDDGAVFDQAFVDAAHRERDRLRSLQPPHVVSRFADPSSWSAVDADGTDDGASWSGLPLSLGTVTGRAWVLDEPADRLPDGFDRSTTVLVARSIDAGWVGTLQLVAGVVAEIGGDLSHGSILIRELGIPAITNARGVTGSLTTGDGVTLDAAVGRLSRSG